MGLSHLESDRPCAKYGPNYYKCRLRYWCFLFLEHPPEELKKGDHHGKEG